MAADTYTVQMDAPVNMEKIASNLSDWLLREHEFVTTEKDWDGPDKYVLEVKKTGFFRQLSGLVFSYKVKLHQTGSGPLFIVIESGDIRDQLVGMGLAIFVAWPLIFTAGWGVYAKGEFRDTIYRQLRKLLDTGLYS